MGTFTYDGIVKADFDDRLLYHLQVTIGAKLRRNETFFFNWNNDVSIGSGRTTVWLHSRASLAFKYAGSRQPKLNLRWVEELTQTANSNAGLQIVPEPPEVPTDDE